MAIRGTSGFTGHHALRPGWIGPDLPGVALGGSGAPNGIDCACSTAVATPYRKSASSTVDLAGGFTTNTTR